jgi:hypothetical protein
VRSASAGAAVLGGGRPERGGARTKRSTGVPFSKRAVQRSRLHDQQL